MDQPILAYNRFLALPILAQRVFGVALVGALFLSIVSLAIHMVQQHRTPPDWLPWVLSSPVAEVLIAPSALEIGGPWLAWLVFCLMVGGLFCLHSRAFTWVRAIWD